MAKRDELPRAICDFGSAKSQYEVRGLITRLIEAGTELAGN